jgi:aldose 1-epimerase
MNAAKRRSKSLFLSAFSSVHRRLIIVVLLAVVPLPAQSRQPWGRTPEGEHVFLYTLTNAHGMEARITNFGAIVVGLRVADKVGHLADVVLGFDTFEEYYRTPKYYGATVGRYANRIAAGQFTLGGVAYAIPRNNGQNTLHGGVRGFNKKVWKERALTPAALELTYRSNNGEEGFPGNLDVLVKFTLTDDNALRIDYSAHTDQLTVVNLTNHSFFNLSGEGSGSVLDDVATIDADRFTPVNAGLIPTGELKPVAGTALDFRAPTVIGSRIHADNPQLKFGKGYDHNYVLNHKPGELALAARIEDPNSGRVLTVLTTEPGVQFYTANNLDGTGGGKSGHTYPPYSAFCVETQHFPDSPNQPSFPTTELRPAETFQSTTEFRFTAK